MPLWKLKSPKAYQKLKPTTIESWLVSENTAEQEFAREALEQLGADAASDYLWSLFQKEQQIVTRRAIVLLSVFLTIVLLGIYTRLILDNHRLGNFFFIWMNVNNLLNIPLNSRARNVSQLQRVIVSDAAKSNNIRDIRILVSALCMTDSGLRTLATQGLTRLLPTLTYADRGLLELKHWKLLHQMAQRAKKPELMQKEGDLEFVGSALKVLGNMRYQPALPLMKEIAAKEPLRPEFEELHRIAAHYVLVWDVSPMAEPIATVSTLAPTEEAPMLLQRH